MNANLHDAHRYTPRAEGRASGSAPPENFFPWARSTFLYTLGLEHTGHHFWEAVTKDVQAESVQAQLWLEEIDAEARRRGIEARLEGYAQPYGNRSLLVDGLAEKFQMTELLYDNKKPLIGINSCSYPCGHVNANGSANHAFADDFIRRPIHPVLLAKAARSATARLRFLLLLRPPGEIFEYYQPWEVDRYDEYCQILQRHVAALAAYDPQLVFPIWYPLTPSYVQSLSKFLRYNVSAEVAAHFRPSNRKGKPLQQLHELEAAGITRRPSWARLGECMTNLSRVFPAPRLHHVPAAASAPRSMKRPATRLKTPRPRPASTPAPIPAAATPAATATLAHWLTRAAGGWG
jgi:hypothetical protein